MGNYDNAANMGADIIFKFLRERMKDRGMTISRVAKEIGIQESTLLRNFAKETEMSLSTYLKVCGALELRPYLVTREGDDTEMDFLHFN